VDLALPFWVPAGEGISKFFISSYLVLFISFYIATYNKTAKTGRPRRNTGQKSLIDMKTSQGSEFLAGTLAHVREPREVGRGEVGVRGEVDDKTAKTGRPRRNTGQKSLIDMKNFEIPSPAGTQNVPAGEGISKFFMSINDFWPVLRRGRPVLAVLL
jgi:membrane protein implicated in regulation of membrane protease activity